MLFNKKPNIKRFNIQPRYWDPAKEEREAREKRVRAEMGMNEDDDSYIPNIRGRMRSEYDRHKSMRSGNGSSYTIRLFMILIMLFMAVGLVVMTNKEGLLRFFGL
ncbi:MAG: hypothetical protein ACRDDZ_04485 [Marinifilaceae bacterium]